jgi:hypothetical protein
LVFKWSYIKLAESGNTKLAVTLFDFLASLLPFFEQTAHCLEEHDLVILMPLLCAQAGQNNAILKDKVKRLIKLVYPVAAEK